MTFAPVGIRCPEHANIGAVRQSPQRTLQNIERATRSMQAPATIVLIALNVVVYLITAPREAASTFPAASCSTTGPCRASRSRTATGGGS